MVGGVSVVEEGATGEQNGQLDHKSTYVHKQLIEKNNIY